MPDTLKRRFTHIHYNGEEVELKFETESGTETDETKRVSSSAPAPEFVDTLRAFKAPLLRFLEQPPASNESAEVRGVTVKYRDGERSGFLISAIRPLKWSNAPYVINTPHIPIPDEQVPPVVSEMIGLLDKLEVAAGLYLDGQRAQQEAFSSEEMKPKNGKRSKPKQEDIEEQAARNIRDREIRAALSSRLPAFTAGHYDDNEIATILVNVFDNIEWVDPEEGPVILGEGKWPGIFKHTPEPVVGGKGVMWHAVRTDNGVPAFWFDIEPMQFMINPGAPVATLSGDTLIHVVRELRGLKAPASQKTRDVIIDAVAEHVLDWVQQKRPKTEAGNYADALALAVYVLCTSWEDGVVTLRSAAAEPTSDEKLLELLDTFAQVRGKGLMRFAVDVLIGEGENTEEVRVEVNRTPPMMLTVGKGKKAKKADPEKLVAVMRGVFGIPEGAAVAVGAA